MIQPELICVPKSGMILGLMEDIMGVLRIADADIEGGPMDEEC